MKKAIVAGLLGLALAGCTAAEQSAVGGAAVGAAVGGVITGDVSGALAGAAVGGTAGYLIGRSQQRSGYCVYRDAQGRLYEARC